jgi:hypothetical protein
LANLGEVLGIPICRRKYPDSSNLTNNCSNNEEEGACGSKKKKS